MDQEHLAARTEYNSLPLRLSRVGRAGTVKPANRGAREVPEHNVTKAGTKAKDNPAPLPEGEDTENLAWNIQKRLVEAEARTKSAFRKKNTDVGCPEEPHRTPTDKHQPGAMDKTMPRGRDDARSNTRTAIPETRDSTAPPKRNEAENLRYLERKPAAQTGKPDFRKSH